MDRYRLQVKDLEHAGSRYTETETRTEYIDEFLIAFGWDVRNAQGLPQSLREVVMERADIGDLGVRPDYRLRVGGRDRLPVEAKRPSVRLAQSHISSTQARSYGWSLSLPAAVLTNWAETVIFDARVTPREGDHADTAVIPGLRISYEDYLDRFDDLWAYIAHESIASDSFYEVYEFTEPQRGSSPFDITFLAEFRRWRLKLAKDMASRNSLSPAEIGRRVQRLLNALLFLRVCEDRNIARYEELLESAAANTVVAAFKRADRAFNAGMFNVLGETSVSDAVLRDVITEMYWPRTKFAFGLLEADVLAGLYEQYLAERVEIDSDQKVTLATKPELTHAGGVVPTPEFIVNELNEAALSPFLEAQDPPPVHVLDLAVGSGIFLLNAFQRLIADKERRGEKVDLEVRATIARECLYGVDIDGAAVEVAKLSLLIAVLGEEVVELSTARRLLPDLSANIIVGNSVVRDDFDLIVPDAAKLPHRRADVAPLDLAAEFGDAYPGAGFEVIVGNPPYIRIQTLSEYMPDQLEYLQDPRSRYLSAQAHNFDIYQVFLERALRILAPNGRLAYIVPHRFTNSLAGSAVREALGQKLERMVHFGEEQVFPGRTTYTALVIAGPVASSPAELELVTDLASWRQGESGELIALERDALTAAPWPIATTAQTLAFAQMEASACARLGDPDWVNIFVGVQTSKDDLFYVSPTSIDDDMVHFVDPDGHKWPIESRILRQSVRDRRIEPYDVDLVPDAWVIFPYLVRPHGPSGKLKATLLTRDELSTTYPLAEKYFAAHEARLRNRSITPNPGEAYWAYGRSQSLTKLDEPKLIVRVLSLSPRYAVDCSGLVAPGGGDGGPYYLLRPQPNCAYSLNTLQAVLSHPAVDLYVTVKGKKYRGSYAVHRKEFLAQVPVPNLSEGERNSIDTTMQEMHSIMRRLRSESDVSIRAALQGRKTYLVTKLNDVITAAFGLDRETVEAITG